MKKIRFVMCALLLSLVMSSCSLSESNIELDSDVSMKSATSSAIYAKDSLSEYLSSNSDKAYQSYISALIDKIQIVDYATQDNVIKIKLSWPNYNELVKAVTTTDLQFQKELINLNKLSSSEEEVNSYIYSYVANYVATNDVANSSYVATSNIVDGKIEDNSFFVLYVKACSNLIADVKANVDLTADTAKLEEVQEQNTLAELTNGKLSVISFKNGESVAKIGLTITGVLRDGEAMKELCTYNSLNNEIKYNENTDTLVLIKYDVRNLEQGQIQYSNRFAYSDGKLLYRNTGNTIYGLITDATIEPDATASFTTAIVMPKDGQVYWYDGQSGIGYTVNLEKGDAE